ncbi:monovalent cation:proton antiporter-2 (CPA2) family protein [Saccharospirillum impatiens]|uniref:monovalent cation:proton antiporter-2 (CPA2) family protein n=1 Tax=Saccharospirillum impatiens TaxID=169438 RepID=UPI0003FA1266|nr:monovalent cation:proton antiporter-2 (CPA2) family protein [Saccharospirillum impatiens]
MTSYLLIAFVFLCAGALAVPLATRLGLGSVLGYLIAGILISPILTLMQVDVISLQHFAEFGVVMMLFLVGLELQPKKLWTMRHRLIGLGGLQVGLSTLAITGIALALGQPWSVALAIGLVLSLSSTAIVLQTLNEKGLFKSDGGQSSFSVLLFQDIAVIPMLALLPLLAIAGLDTGSATHAADDHGATLSLVANLTGWQTALVTLAAIALVVVAGNYLTRPMFNFIALARLRELFTAAALLIVIGIALLMSLVGLSPALGTFLAGVVLANSEYRHELESDIAPFKGLLLGLFFMTVGAGINFGLLGEHWLVLLALTTLLILVKAGVLMVLGRLFNVTGADRWLLALGLAQAGEFGFVLISFTVASAVIPPAIADPLLLIVALSMVITPALFIAYDRIIVPRFEHGQEDKMDDITDHGDVLIIGHGRVGGMVNRMLRAGGVETTVVDFSSSQLELLRAFGLRVFFGDGTRPDLLKAAHIEDVRMVVIAIDDKDKITELARYISATYPSVHILARAIDRMHVYDLWSVGCRDIIRETYDSSLRMGRSAFEALGYDSATARTMATDFESIDRASMVELASLYDINKPIAQNEAYIERVKTLMEEWEQQLKKPKEDQPDSPG